MPFSEKVKLEVKKRANFTCCWCEDRQRKVDVHHIVPQAEGGPDTIDNAAPLCGSCHDAYGNNPDLRKEIRSRRDHLYERRVHLERARELVASTGYGRREREVAYLAGKL